MTERAKTRIRCTTLLLLALLAGCAAAATDPSKVLHIASPDVDTLDPQQDTNIPAQRVIAEIFEGLYNWDYLGPPGSQMPVTASAMPEVSDDGRTWLIRLK
ncbi:MAG: ABC transporter substrate-binding protein, partial [Steroidobacterales bacterium]